MDSSDTSSKPIHPPKASAEDSMASSVNPSSPTITSVLDLEKSTNGKQSGNKNKRGPRTREHRSRGSTRGDGRRETSFSRNKRSDMGRAEWSRNAIDKRARNEASQQAIKRLKANDEGCFTPIYASPFSKEEIEAEEKKPKRKVAVMIGYSGTGYKGMQLNHHEKTIEGDLFSAFVAAGAVSKANADDPKKSSLVRCARTDKGVHAAGNLISMKLIVEDTDIVRKINEKLSSQIRVFGIERTNGSFNAYQLCDSRIYEYLIPTHCFIPPHPSSYLGKKLIELAKEGNDYEEFEKRQSEASGFWTETEDRYIKPILDQLDPVTRPLVLKALYDTVEEPDLKLDPVNTVIPEVSDEQDLKISPVQDKPENEALLYRADSGISLNEPVEKPQKQVSTGLPASNSSINTEITIATMEDASIGAQTLISKDLNQLGEAVDISSKDEGTERNPEDQARLDLAIRQLKAAYIAAKKAYRIDPDRLAKVRSVLSRFEGSRNFHNYTISKAFSDPSAKRFIKSFVVNGAPKIINNTEWLSLKVHGQSFMMHQIRKMVSMVALVIRSGCHEGRLQDSWMQEKIIIPKSPGSGLLLERPVFEYYNEHLDEGNDRKSIDFQKYATEMEEFKQSEIYQRIFREEERDNQFHTFFASIDNLKSSRFLYLSSIGILATTRSQSAETSGRGLQEDSIDESSSEEEKDEDG